MKKLFYTLLGIGLAWATVVGAVQVSVPSSPSDYYFLVSSTTGNYTASATPFFKNSFSFTNSTGTQATTTNLFSTKMAANGITVTGLTSGSQVPFVQIRTPDNSNVSKVLSLYSAGADWNVWLGTESVPNIYIGGSSGVSQYFWRANWNNANVAANTFASAATDATQVPLEIVGQSSQSAHYLDITKSGSTQGGIFTVDGSGKVGINSSSPSAPLDVEKAVGNVIANFGNGNFGNLQIDSQSSPNRYRLVLDNSGPSLEFVTSGGNILLDPGQGGHVGIGTTTPKWALQISTSTGPQLTISDSASLASDHWSFRNAGGIFYLSTSSPTTYATSTVSAITINSNGATTLEGNLTVNSGIQDNPDGYHFTGSTAFIGAENGQPRLTLSNGSNKLFIDGNGSWFNSNVNSTGVISAVSFLASGSSTLQNFTGVNATTTSATSTNLYASSYANLNALYGASLATCTSASSALTWTAGQFGCHSIAGGGGSGGGTWATSSVGLYYVNYPLNTTDVVVIGAQATGTSKFYFDPNTSLANIFGTASTTNLFVQGSSTLQNFTGVNATTTNATSSNFAVTNLTANKLISTNAIGGLVSTSTIGNNQLANSSITVNSTAISLGSSGTITAASSTLLGDTNNFIGGNVFGNASSTNFYVSGNASTSSLYLGLGVCSGTSALNINSVGKVTCGAITDTNASSTLLTDNNAFSGLDTFTDLKAVTRSTTTDATTTSLSVGNRASSTSATISGIKSALIVTNSSGDESAYTGATSCGANNFFTGFSALGASSCGTASITTSLTGIAGGGTVSLGGTLTLTSTIATSSAETSSQVPYWTTTNGGVAKLGSVATSSLVQSTGINISNGTTAYVIGSQPTFTIDQTFTPTWTGAHIFRNTSNSSAELTIQDSGSNPIFVANSINRNIGIGTSTPRWALEIASSTGGQLTLSDGSLTSNHWTFRNAGGNFYLATSSPTTFATSSISTLSITAGGVSGFVGIGTSTPNAPLHIYGAEARKVTTTAASYTIATTSDNIIGVTSTASARTITLPYCTDQATLSTRDLTYTIKDQSGGAAAHNITLQTVGANNVDGASTAVININYQAMNIYCDGSNWFVY